MDFPLTGALFGLVILFSLMIPDRILDSKEQQFFVDGYFASYTFIFSKTDF